MEKSAYVKSFVNEFKVFLDRYIETQDPKLYDLVIGRYEYAMFIQDEIRNGCIKVAQMAIDEAPYKDIKNMAYNYAHLGHE